MSLYSVGDLVRVRDDLHVTTYRSMEGGTDDDCLCVPDMERRRGQTVKIVDVWPPNLETGTRYLIDEDNGCWCWVDEMFVGLAYDNEDDTEIEFDFDDLF